MLYNKSLLVICFICCCCWVVTSGSLRFTHGLQHARSLPKFMSVESVILYVKVKSPSHVWLFETPWTVAYQAPQYMEFSRQEYWSELPFPSPGDLPNPRIEPGSLALQTDTLPSEPPKKPNFTCRSVYMSIPISQFLPPLSSGKFVCFLYL